MIVRDVDRVDDYPDGDTKGKGISAWFKVELLGTYHRGIEVGLSLHVSPPKEAERLEPPCLLTFLVIGTARTRRRN